MKTTAVSRGQYYDRNRTSVSMTYNVAAVAPAGFTTRWTYTVPSGRRAFIESIFALQYVAAASAPVGKVTAEILATSNTVQAILVSTLDGVGTLGTSKSANAGNSGVLIAADNLASQTADVGTGGSKDYKLSTVVTEFDA